MRFFWPSDACRASGLLRGTCAGLALTVALTLAPSVALAQEPDVECVPLTIGAVDVLRQELFPERGGAVGWTYRTGNKLHIDTRPAVVWRELLFAEGDPLDAESLTQSERNLRALRFISAARVDVVFADGKVVHAEQLAPELCASPGAEQVDILVTTRDSWSTQLEGKLSKSGNRLLWEVGLDESNLLGLGKSVGVGFAREIDRDSFRVGFRDPQVAGSRHELSGEYRDQSDGASVRLAGGRFVKSLEDVWSYDGRVEHFDQTQPLYASGEQVGGLRHSRRHYAVQGGRAVYRGRASTMRVYFGYRHEFDDVEVERRDFDVLQVGATFVHHGYRQIRWIDHERPVDVNLGAESGIWFGYAVRNESTRQGDTFFVAANHSQGLALGDSRLVLASAAWESRVRGGRAENGTLRARLLLADYTFRRQVLLVQGRIVWGVRLDPEVQVTLGVESGLRGYRVNEFVGDRSLLLSVEHRWFFAEDVLGLVSLGLAGFVDSGYAWRRGTPARFKDLHSNLGIGLLIGRKQVSTANAGARIDMAYALDPIQGQGRWVLSFGTTHGF